jgi:hypothetical protein
VAKAKRGRKKAGGTDGKADALVSLLQSNLIVQLVLAGVDSQSIARIVGVHVTRRVSPIATAVRKARRKIERSLQRKRT